MALRAWASVRRVRAAAADPRPALQQLRFQRGDLVAARPHQLQLALGVAVERLEDLAPAHRILDAFVPLASQRRAVVFGFDQVLQPVERDAEQALQPDQLVSRSTSAGA